MYKSKNEIFLYKVLTNDPAMDIKKDIQITLEENNLKSRKKYDLDHVFISRLCYYYLTG